MARLVISKIKKNKFPIVFRKTLGLQRTRSQKNLEDLSLRFRNEKNSRTFSLYTYMYPHMD